VLIVVVQWVAVFIGFRYFQGTMVQLMLMFLGPTLGTLLFVAWWYFASRVSRGQRWNVLGGAVVAAIAMYFLSDATFGGFGLVLYALPAAMTAWTLWLLISYALPWRIRYVGLCMVVVLAFELFTLVRLNGVYGNFMPIFSWRWRVKEEDRFLADRQADKIGVLPVAESPPLRWQPGDWPGFRGPDRDGKLTGVRIATDWDVHPPKLLWKHRVGNAWSSFAVIGKRLFTQEQNDKFESVICYDADTGKILWEHQDEGRFINDETVAGIGPRATPTFYKSKIYALGAKGLLNCLDAGSGIKQWTRDIKIDSEAKEPRWGYASSPLIAQGNVIVFAGGPAGKALVAYNAETGKLAWTAGAGDQLSYCSPQLAKIDGVEQVVLTSNAGLLAIDPKDGTVLWTFESSSGDQVRVVQPAQVQDSDFLLGSGFGAGTKRVHVHHADTGWEAKEVWNKRTISPYYNDMVVHKGHAYGFDNGFFSCINLKDGKKKWTTRGDEAGDGYGSGQVLLLADQDLLLIVCEKGEVALVEANPADYKELSRFDAIKEPNSKAWNHPVVAHGRLFVRSDHWAACFQLTELNK